MISTNHSVSHDCSEEPPSDPNVAKLIREHLRGQQNNEQHANYSRYYFKVIKINRISPIRPSLSYTQKCKSLVIVIVISHERSLTHASGVIVINDASAAFISSCSFSRNVCYFFFHIQISLCSRTQ